MKRVDFKKHSSVFYIGKGLIIASVVITVSLGFLLGFFVGKQVHPQIETKAPSIAPVKEKEPEQNPQETPVKGLSQQESETSHGSEPEQNATPVQDQKASESRTTRTAQTTGGNLRDTSVPPSEKRFDQAGSQGASKTKQAQPIKPTQVSPDKKDTRIAQDKQQSPKTAAARKYTVQVGAFKNPEEADALKTKMSKKGYKAFVTASKTKKQDILHKVMVGEYKTRKEAEVLSIKLKNSEGLRTFVTFVMQEDATRQQ
jgi:cell division septation protein DedD